MAAGHRNAALAAWLVLSASGCGPEPEPDRVVAIRAHWWPRCGPPERSAELDFTLSALGDFDPAPTTVESASEGDDVLRLGLPADTRAVEVTATNGFDDWSGVGEVSGSAVDVALWPEGSACELFRAGPYPTGSGQAVGAGRGTLLVFGGGDTTASMTSGILVDLDAARVDAPPLDPRARRTHATATAFGDDLLVAGGRDTLDGPRVLATAEILDVATRRFEAEPLDLSTGRARHAAVTLSDGDILLIGGEGADGRALRTLEIISRRTRRYRIEELADLEVARIDPQALTLDDGRIVVAGGIGSDGQPLQSIEWLSPDATRAVHVLDALDSSQTVVGRALSPMPGGGVLVAGGCADRDPQPGEEAACAAACGQQGCPSLDVHWIDRSGAVTALPSLPRPAPHPTLSVADAGRPWLATGHPTDPALLRFDPWQARFVALTDLSGTLPGAGASLVSSRGTLVWLERGPNPSLWGMRLARRSEWSADVAPLVVAGLDGLAPDRAPGDAVHHDRITNVVVLADADARLMIADTTYADLALDIRADGPPPIVRLGSRSYGDPSCPWPDPSTATDRFQLSRAGDVVTLRLADREQTCSADEDRVDIAIATPGPELRIRSLTIRRDAESMTPR